ncbi:MAG TPA: UxaA family hydrolase [Sphaerochaeta sp.]|nr:UxaA family hydrolase [Sphaerochaeta sp.]HOQ94520.1 UxaA family hydrolase [Sphaerochaeta sp.]HPK47121.1 UxaA family hydrolase [Sphaerochaeta sp.]
MNDTFMGYVRSNGDVGVRNHVVVLPTIGCANELAWRISKQVPDSVLLTHNHACIRLGEDAERAKRTLVGIGRNPNVHSVLVVGLGCEPIQAEQLAAWIATTGKEVVAVSVETNGSYDAVVEEGVARLTEMVSHAAGEKRVPCDVSKLTIGIKCGGSGTISAVSSNPSVGYAADRLVDAGGTVLFTETAELIGAQDVLAQRACCEEVKVRLLGKVDALLAKVKQNGVDILGSEPTQGNILSGLTTIEEKSLGAISKSGTSVLRGVLDYAQPPSEPGLFFVDGTTQASQLFVGMFASGAQIQIFSYGGGFPARFRYLPSYPPGMKPLPVIKVLGSSDDVSEKEHFDIYAGDIVTGTESVESVGNRIYSLILDIASGTETYTDVHSEYHEMIQLYADGLLM